MNRVLSLYLPTWPTDRLCRKLGAAAPPPEQPLGLQGSDGRRRVIVALNPAAFRAGARIGMPVTKARALVHHLDLREHDGAADSAGLEQLAHWAYRNVSPLAAADHPDGIVIDTTGTDHLYGGETSMADGIVARLAAMGIRSRIAIADTWGAAHALARFGTKSVHIIPPGEDGAEIGRLPVGALRLPSDIVSGLAQLGFERMGLPDDMIVLMNSQLSAWSDKGVDESRIEGLGINLNERRVRLAIDIAQGLIGTPRHLSQHPGGFVLTRDRLDDLVPIEPAAMDDRQIIEWDKDDIDALKFMKVDVLALGMLTCMKRGLDMLAAEKGIALDLATIPAECPKTFAMIRKADTLGTFQIESRAQMAMLPRMKPRTFYDLVVEVAIVRPGPIQGDMVHPYLRRREGKEEVIYPTAELERVLGKTLGVPLFQEQAMRVAIECAGLRSLSQD